MSRLGAQSVASPRPLRGAFGNDLYLRPVGAPAGQFHMRARPVAAVQALGAHRAVEICALAATGQNEGDRAVLPADLAGVTACAGKIAHGDLRPVRADTPRVRRGHLRQRRARAVRQPIGLDPAFRLPEAGATGSPSPCARAPARMSMKTRASGFIALGFPSGRRKQAEACRHGPAPAGPVRGGRSAIAGAPALHLPLTSITMPLPVPVRLKLPLVCVPSAFFDMFMTPVRTNPAWLQVMSKLTWFAEP